MGGVPAKEPSDWRWGRLWGVLVVVVVSGRYTMRGGWVGTAWGHAGPGQPELTVEEAGLGSGVAFGVAIPSPAQLLAIEEVPQPGAGVQTVPAGREICAQLRPPHARPRPRRKGPAPTPLATPPATPPVSASLPSLTVCLLFALLSRQAKIEKGTDTPKAPGPSAEMGTEGFTEGTQRARGLFHKRCRS